MRPVFASGRLKSILTSLALTTLAGCGQEAALPAKMPALVRTQVVQLADYGPVLAFTGEIRARVQSDLSFGVSGRVVERNADVGAHVTPDLALAKLDPELQLADLRAANATVAAVEARFRQASASFERQKTLLARGFTTRREYDQNEAAFRTAQGSLDAAKAQLAMAKEQLSYTILRTDRAGIITSRNIEGGQIVEATQSAFTIAQDGPRDVVFNIYESGFTHGLADNSIKMRLLSDPKVTFRGSIREISPAIDPATGTVRVKVGVDTASPEMTLGAAVIGTSRFKPGQFVILPWSALSSQNGEAAVWVVDARTKMVSLTPVEIEAFKTSEVVIRNGLRPGQIVVTAGAQLLRPNETVALAGEVTR